MDERIGKYRMIRPVAQGGMAEIFLATASGIEGFEKLCVIKRILPLLASDAELVQMFLDEARLQASLHHSNIAQVFDIGSDGGRHYFVMEFLRGEDVYHILKASMSRGQLIPLEHVVTIMTGVCAGLHYAHELRGSDGKPLHIVHRDISPQNIFVTHEGNVKLCDFGIAKSRARATQTRAGTVKGKVRYMSPEQCKAEPLDRRSDVFSLCIVLWELIALRPLYRAKSDLETFMAIVGDPPPAPSSVRPDVPRELDAIVAKGLAKDPQDRFQTAQELQLALEAWARATALPTSSIGLGRYMSELFGPPEQDFDTFLSRVTEDDPLARRIRSLGPDDGADDEPEMEVGLAGAAYDPTTPLRVQAASKTGRTTGIATTLAATDGLTPAAPAPVSSTGEAPATPPPRRSALVWVPLGALPFVASAIFLWVRTPTQPSVAPPSTPAVAASAPPVVPPTPAPERLDVPAPSAPAEAAASSDAPVLAPEPQPRAKRPARVAGKHGPAETRTTKSAAKNPNAMLPP